MKRLLYERGFIIKPKMYDITKRFPEHAFMAEAGRSKNVGTEQDDLNLLSKFYKKYPEVKYFPQGS